VPPQPIVLGSILEPCAGGECSQQHGRVLLAGIVARTLKACLQPDHLPARVLQIINLLLLTLHFAKVECALLDGRAVQRGRLWLSMEATYSLRVALSLTSACGLHCLLSLDNLRSVDIPSGCAFVGAAKVPFLYAGG